MPKKERDKLGLKVEDDGEFWLVRTVHVAIHAHLAQQVASSPGPLLMLPAKKKAALKSQERGSGDEAIRHAQPWVDLP